MKNGRFEKNKRNRNYAKRIINYLLVKETDKYVT